MLKLKKINLFDIRDYCNVIIKLRAVFIKISNIFFTKRIFLKKLKFKKILIDIGFKYIKKTKVQKRYSFKKYNVFFKKKKWEKPVLKENSLANFCLSNIWTKPLKINVNFKGYFHIKTIYNLHEFLLYDYYNFYKNSINFNINNLANNEEHEPSKPWKKLNFMYYIKQSINVFRIHTLRFFKFKSQSTRKNTIFFQGFDGFSVLAYIWFFEYSLPYFLIKTRFAESIGQGFSICYTGLLFVNNLNQINKWAYVTPGDFLQVTFSLYYCLRIKKIIINFLSFFKKSKKFLIKTTIHQRNKNFQMPYINKKSVWLNSSKQITLRFFECDYKTNSVCLLPYNNPNVYYTCLTLMWSNFWNYRTNNWKYKT